MLHLNITHPRSYMDFKPRQMNYQGKADALSCPLPKSHGRVEDSCIYFCSGCGQVGSVQCEPLQLSETNV